MHIVRFVTDFGAYAAGDEAAFNEQYALYLQSKGIAILVRPVDAPVQVEVTLPTPAATHPIANVPVVEDKRRVKV